MALSIKAPDIFVRFESNDCGTGLEGQAEPNVTQEADVRQAEGTNVQQTSAMFCFCCLRCGFGYTARLELCTILLSLYTLPLKTAYLHHVTLTPTNNTIVTLQ